jgi:hypothetical protein
MTFDICKFTTLVIKSMNFIPSRHYKNNIFKLEMNRLSSINQYTYLGTTFNKSLDLELIIVKMNSKINYTI